jgi:hypothetical protein
MWYRAASRLGFMRARGVGQYSNFGESGKWRSLKSLPSFFSQSLHIPAYLYFLQAVHLASFRLG